MGKELTVEADRFAVSLEAILGEVQHGVDESLMPSIKKACQTGAREERKKAPVETGEYKKGIAYMAKGRKGEAFGEIGNKNKPGLAHLLEKGHATGGGGRVQGREHIAPAADVTFKKLEEELGKSIDKVLQG